MNNKMGLSKAEVDEIRMFVMQFSDVESVVLFGSRAKGTHKPGSDVDLAILGDAVSYSTINELSYLLNEESVLPYYFDVINVADISSSALLSHIKEYGVEFNL
ncbi:nucleotidyltransferase domain-containing protein [Pseudoalteromonas sp. C2R02]|uniref:nucleotidyltransferase family protein n=1 Tax=Pseudoalteromonas sp. C2R02 TaxID=2841565 RepID=UPI0020917EC0|nr:nucleotidyltransferase domain-containing protein [Pseudoalteromonas sp. C2R02]